MTIIPTMLFDGERKSSHTFLFAHGAGAPMDSPFMAAFAESLAATGMCVGRFEFSYMQRRRAEGGKRWPSGLRSAYTVRRLASRYQLMTVPSAKRNLTPY